MKNVDAFRLDRLKLQNFRCFEECTIELHPRLTVLVAENGQGKTAVLDGIRIALGLFVGTMSDAQQMPGFDRTDVHLVKAESGLMVPALPTELAADGFVAGKAIHWRRVLSDYNLRARTTTKEAETLRRVALELRSKVLKLKYVGLDEIQPRLPLVAFYGTGRLWNEYRLTKERAAATARGAQFAGYIDCLSSSSSFKGVVAWYEMKWNETQDPKFATKLQNNIAQLAAVQEAVRMVLEPTEWCELDWDFERKSLVVGHREHGRLPLSALSDGVRNMVALVADIAYRCACLNPDLGGEAARQTPGVILIDQVDMHLHPRWQQQIVELLRKTFPLLQLILTTHSPHVLSTVDKESIRMIRLQDGKGLIETPSLQTRGVESADVLASIMGVDPVPQVEEARLLSDYRALIEDGLAEGDDAQSMRLKLNRHFGESHPLIVDCDRLIRFQKFKISKKNPPEEV